MLDWAEASDRGAAWLKWKPGTLPTRRGASGAARLCSTGTSQKDTPPVMEATASLGAHTHTRTQKQSRCSEILLTEVLMRGEKNPKHSNNNSNNNCISNNDASTGPVDEG